MTVDIADDDDLRRHINPAQYNDDGTISLAAYKTKNMSVDLCRLRSLAESMARHPEWGMVEFKAGIPRGAGLTVIYDPIKDDPDGEPDNPAHCQIPGRINDGPAKKLRDAARPAYTPARVA